MTEHATGLQFAVMVGMMLEREGSEAATSTNETSTEEWLRALTVGDLMSTDVHTVGPNDPLRETHQFMRNAGIRHLPVLEDGKLVGIASDRDLLLGWSLGGQTPVGEVMTRYTQFVHPETLAREAATQMLKQKIGCLAVLDADGALVGIITETDFLRVAHRALTIQAMSAS